MRKCIECQEAYTGDDLKCPYCGSDDTIELQQVKNIHNYAYIESCFKGND